MEAELDTISRERVGGWLVDWLAHTGARGASIDCLINLLMLSSESLHEVEYSLDSTIRHAVIERHSNATKEWMAAQLQ